MLVRLSDIKDNEFDKRARLAPFPGLLDVHSHAGNSPGKQLPAAAPARAPLSLSRPPHCGAKPGRFETSNNHFSTSLGVSEQASERTIERSGECKRSKVHEQSKQEGASE